MAISLPESGLANVPVVNDRFKILESGFVSSDVNFHTTNVIYPIGYKANRLYWDCLNPNENGYASYCCSIVNVDQGNGTNCPRFRVEYECGDRKKCWESDVSPIHAWNHVLREMKENLKDGMDAVLHLSGMQAFGLSIDKIRQWIEDKCILEQENGKEIMEQLKKQGYIALRKDESNKGDKTIDKQMKQFKKVPCDNVFKRINKVIDVKNSENAPNVDDECIFICNFTSQELKNMGICLSNAGNGSNDSRSDDFDLNGMNWTQTAKEHLIRIKNRPNSNWFVHAVDEERDKAPNYYQMIKTPMHLNRIEKKLNRNKYDNLEQVYEDISLIWKNAKDYNHETHPIHLIASEFEHLTNKLFGKLDKSKDSKQSRQNEKSKEKMKSKENEKEKENENSHLQLKFEIRQKDKQSFPLFICGNAKCDETLKLWNGFHDGCSFENSVCSQCGNGLTKYYYHCMNGCTNKDHNYFACMKCICDSLNMNENVKNSIKNKNIDLNGVWISVIGFIEIDQIGPYLKMRLLNKDLLIDSSEQSEYRESGTDAIYDRQRNEAIYGLINENERFCFNIIDKSSEKYTLSGKFAWNVDNNHISKLKCRLWQNETKKQSLILRRLSPSCRNCAKNGKKQSRMNFMKLNTFPRMEKHSANYYCDLKQYCSQNNNDQFIQRKNWYFDCSDCNFDYCGKCCAGTANAQNIQQITNIENDINIMDILFPKQSNENEKQNESDNERSNEESNEESNENSNEKKDVLQEDEPPRKRRKLNNGNADNNDQIEIDNVIDRNNEDQDNQDNQYNQEKKEQIDHVNVDINHLIERLEEKEKLCQEAVSQTQNVLQQVRAQIQQLKNLHLP